MSLSSHQSASMKNDEWLTPPEFFAHFPVFDLDPCSPIKRPWPTAKNHFTVETDGLSRKWVGSVWLNPPFSRKWPKWVKKLADHGNGIALLAARTETAAFFDLVWGRADSILFLKGRPYFHFVDGSRAGINSGAPICLIAYGASSGALLRVCGLPGKLIQLKSTTT